MRLVPSKKITSVATVLCLFGLVGCTKPTPTPTIVAVGPVVPGGPIAPANTGTPAPAATKYTPRVSEKKFQDFLKGREQSDITDEQVYAIMGEPTRREAPVTGKKNGQTFTVYTAFWEVPGSGISSSIVFANGRMSGMALGFETSSPGSKDGKKTTP